MEGHDTDAAVAPLFSTVFVLSMHRLEMIKTGREVDVRHAGAPRPERYSSQTLTASNVIFAINGS